MDKRIHSSIAFLGCALASLGCAREERRFDELAALAAPARRVTTARASARFQSYEHNAWSVAEGKRSYTWFNCAGCHAQGGGGEGPALIDRDWRYGSTPQDIYETIVNGRPNGMPSYAGKLTEQQVWQLVAYVRALGGMVRLDVQPGRSDALSGRPPEVMLEHQGASDMSAAGSP